LKDLVAKESNNGFDVVAYLGGGKEAIAESQRRCDNNEIEKLDQITHLLHKGANKPALNSQSPFFFSVNKCSKAFNWQLYFYRAISLQVLFW
jgi:hypothetical protein